MQYNKPNIYQPNQVIIDTEPDTTCNGRKITTINEITLNDSNQFQNLAVIMYIEQNLFTKHHNNFGFLRLECYWAEVHEWF
mgnify:FL=1